MKCVICKEGETRQGQATLTLEREGATLVFKKVPAQVCSNCGEAYVEEAISKKLLETAEQAARAGVVVDIREYLAATA